MTEKVRGKDQIPYYNFQCDQFNIIADCWLCGPPEKDQFGQKFPGAFPAGFLNHVKDAFKTYWPERIREVLHVCAGRVPKSEGRTLDIDRKFNPDYFCNAEDMRLLDGELVPSEEFKFTISDTPYNEDAAKKYYKKPMIDRNAVLRQMNRVTQIHGLIGILDQITTSKPPINLQVVARIGVTSVPNLDMRYFTVLKKIGIYRGKEKGENSIRMENYF